MQNRGRVIAFVFFPVIVLVWILGWILYWLGAKDEAQKTIRQVPIVDDAISIATDRYEEAVITED